jgi:protein-L-isoaspartate(D-aspartate) O-methyltransferase
MTMESVAGKNPLTHVGKLYNITAGMIADALVRELPEVVEARCWLMSRIGQPVGDPAMVDLKLGLADGMQLSKVEPAARAITQAEIARLSEISDGLIAGDILPDRWPLGPHGAGVGPFGKARQALVEALAQEASRTATYTRRSSFSREVLQAIANVPRHRFVAKHLTDSAYLDRPLPIGSGQVISQPYLVALMTDLLDLTPEDVVLEIGTGSGYQAGVLSILAQQVYSIEVVPELAATAGCRLRRLGYSNVIARVGNGRAGWPERAPFDAIIVTAAAAAVPPPLLAQLKPGGRLVMPLGEVADVQWLYRLTKDAAGNIHKEEVLPVSFVPLLGD